MRRAPAARARGRRVIALAPPPSKGDQIKIEDDGSAAERLADWLAEKKLL